MEAYKFIFVVGLITVFLAGVITLKNFNKWFGPDVSIPSETEGARILNKGQVVLIWALSMKLMLMMVLVF